MSGGWQETWTFRVVDPVTGVAVPGVPVSVVDEGGRSAGAWVSDVDGLVRIPKHDGSRLRLRVGLRSEEVIEMHAPSLPDEPVPIAAPGGDAAAPAAADVSGSVPPAPRDHPGHVQRFARIGVLPQDADALGSDQEPRSGAALRYGLLLEVEQVWQSLGSQAGDTLYSVALGPGDEVKVAVLDGRWRRRPDLRDRPLQIVAKMVATLQVCDGMDAAPLEACIVPDVATAAAETVRYLSERTVLKAESLRRRPLGVYEVEVERPEGSSLRTVRNMRSDGVLTYHFLEPLERWRVIVRTPRPRAAMLVPFRLPNIATREVVRRFGHALRRGLLDRSLLPDMERVLGPDEPPAAVERRVFRHIAAHLPYYSATIIAAGDPAERFFALAKLRDARRRVLTDIIANVVVGRVGNYVAFPLRSLDDAPPEWRAALDAEVVGRLRLFHEAIVTLPLPGVWLRAQLSPAVAEAEPAGEGTAEGEQASATPARAKRR